MIRHEIIKDITRPNEFISVGSELPFQASAIVWSMQSGDSVTQKIKLCMQDLLSRLNKIYPESQMFLIAGHNVNQDDNRITRFNGFWKSLKKRNMEIPEGIFYNELIFENKNSIRYCGVIKFELDQIDKIVNVMRNSLSLIILLETDIPNLILSSIAQEWFNDNRNLNNNLMKRISGILNLLGRYPIIGITIYGDFDDYEAYVVGVAKEELLRKFIQTIDKI